MIRPSYAVSLMIAGWLLQASPAEFGRFVGDVDARFDADGRTMTLLADFSYIDASGFRWLAPKGSRVDGASIPRFAWSFIGGPFEGEYRKASVIHDVACNNKRQPWVQVHRAFYNAMMAAGTPQWLAKVMYAAVYHFGPRWPGQDKVAPPPYRLTRQEFDELRQSIIHAETAKRPGIVGESGLSFQEIEEFDPKKKNRYR